MKDTFFTDFGPKTLQALCKTAVNAPIETSVPKAKALKNAAPLRNGNARAGRQNSKASGCIPESTPVPKVFQVKRCASSLPLSSCHAEASLKPIQPIAMRTIPTAAVEACSASAPRPNFASMGATPQLAKPSIARPRTVCPRTCPDPHSIPVRKAEVIPRPRDIIAKGAKAARWSGPDSVCNAPAPAPAAAAATMPPEGLVKTACAACANVSKRDVAQYRAATAAQTASDRRTISLPSRDDLRGSLFFLGGGSG
mmetsp:Transcript_8956/g.15804  ORF Transcript_8956/g.15804 Transcript_8956/m.15804 type:complete len:254 (+) Transcript_8956:443-1204(+)|eukprot:CAMPEP_0197655928 /NCGR_PEP_ID=MMETSP1338-20131121/39753_1 /TAXON_ID=43686 ORGANISM="Pelagodinium beii, Strain RCC1491" /NCGR_SAMPLE_ID=MMETSP1338 /ASSEMBLY_ACC=CAM_ASM_000754 /LENGTH=253 /DNA_ID=CAMNT_0043231677 /DNA_START=361 /DNA_END=1122 /DNA_ORIENTATION=+